MRHRQRDKWLLAGLAVITAPLLLAACSSSPAVVASGPGTTADPPPRTSPPAPTTSTTVPATTTTALAPGIQPWSGQAPFVDSTGQHWTLQWSFGGATTPSYNPTQNHGNQGTVLLPVSGSFVLTNTGSQPQPGVPVAIIAYFPGSSPLCTGMPTTPPRDVGQVTFNGTPETACALPLLEGKFTSTTMIAPGTFASQQGTAYDSVGPPAVSLAVYVPDPATPDDTPDVTTVLHALVATTPILTVASVQDSVLGTVSTNRTDSTGCSVSFHDLQFWQVLTSQPAGLQCSS